MKSKGNKHTQEHRQPGTEATPASTAGAGNPIREWLPSLGLGRASRPGCEAGEANPEPAVDRWVKTVRAQGFRSVICLLSEEELGRYSHVPGGLLGRYEHLGLEVRSIPLPPDRTPVLTGENRCSVVEAYEDLPKPVLVHCSAGVVRSGAAVRHLVKLLSDSGTKSPSETEHKEILRLIRNSRMAYSICALGRGRYGMEDYGRLGHLLQRAARHCLEEYLKEIDAVRATHHRCPPCSLKFLAFCRIYSAGRLPERHRAYRNEFMERNKAWPNDRDFMAEVRQAIYNAPGLRYAPPTNVRYYHSLGEELPC
jgi:hypothetical protein